MSLDVAENPPGGGTRVVTRFSTAPCAWVIAYLAERPECRKTREDISEQCWPNAGSRGSLNNALTRIKAGLKIVGVDPDSVLDSDTHDVWLNKAIFRTDVHEFAEALRLVHFADGPAERAERLADAVSIYQGAFMRGASNSWIEAKRNSWIEAKRNELAQLYFDAVEDLISLLRSQERSRDALRFALTAACRDPLRESLHLQIMALYASLGRAPLALRHYRRLTRQLWEEQQMAPCKELQQLADSIRGQRISEAGRPAYSRTEKTGPRLFEGAPLRRRNLPLAKRSYSAQPRTEMHPGTRAIAFENRFVGRDLEIGAIRGLLANSETSAVTVTGPGGIGKSRVCWEAAKRMDDLFGDSVWFISLAELSEPRLLGSVIAQEMGLPNSPTEDPLDQIVQALGSHPGLLVLDSFEQVADAGARTARSLLERAPRLKLLISSWLPTGLAGEIVFPLGPLPLPEGMRAQDLASNESVMLLLARAEAAGRKIEISEANAALVAELVRELEGIPLAIELAAARLKSMTLEILGTQIRRRFDLLVSDEIDRQSRHRSLWATLDWTFRQLPPELQSFFPRLSVFHGTWTYEAVGAVLGVGSLALEYLEQLREDSFLQTLEVAVGQERTSRYCMLESLREFGSEKLPPDERSDVSRRHADYYLAFAKAAFAGLGSPQTAEWLGRLSAENDNLIAALKWTTRFAPADALVFAMYLPQYWDYKGHWAEGCRFLSHLLDFNPTGDASLRARALLALGNLSQKQRNYAEAHRALQESREIFEALEEKRPASSALLGLGILLEEQGLYQEARTYLEQSLQIKESLWRRNQDPVDQRGLATVRANLGYLSYLEGKSELARQYLEAAISAIRGVWESQTLASALNNLGGVLRLERDYVGSRQALEEALLLRIKLGDENNRVYSFVEFARLAAAQGEWPRATRLLGAAEAACERLAFRIAPPEPSRCAALAEELTDALGSRTFREEWDRGFSLAPEQAIRFALEKA